MKAHEIYDVDDETGAELDRVIARVHPASPESVELVMQAPEDGFDGRSNWVWLRLSNGDLFLGVFPQGDTYLSVDEDSRYPEPAAGDEDLRAPRALPCAPTAPRVAEVEMNQNTYRVTLDGEPATVEVRKARRLGDHYWSTIKPGSQNHRRAVRLALAQVK